jgi:hypothetical protein
MECLNIGHVKYNATNVIFFYISSLLYNICIFTCSASLLKASKRVSNAVFDFKIYINMTRVQTPRVQIAIANLLFSKTRLT